MGNADLVRRAHQLWIAGDLDTAFEDMAHPDIEWAEPPNNVDSTTARGREWALKSLRDWSDQFASLRADLVELRERGAKVLAEFQQAVTPHGGTIELQNEFFMVWTFADGKAVRMQMFNDREQAEAAFEGA